MDEIIMQYFRRFWGWVTGGRVTDVEGYFSSLEKVAEAEEAKNKRIQERLALKKREARLKQRIVNARVVKRRKLMASMAEYDPKLARRRRLYFQLAIVGVLVLLFLAMRACSGC